MLTMMLTMMLTRMLTRDVDKRWVDGVNMRVVIEMRKYFGYVRRNNGDCDRDCDGDMKGHERWV